MKTTEQKEFGETPNTQNSSTLIESSNDTTVSTVGQSSTGLVSEPIINGIPLNRLDWFLESLNDNLTIFDNLIRGNVTYDRNIKGLELYINHLKRRIEYEMGNMDKLFFQSGFQVSGYLMDLYEEVMERLNDIRSQFLSLNDENTIGFSEPVVEEVLLNIQIDLNFCKDYLLKKRTQKNVFLNSFLNILVEYEPLLEQINETVKLQDVTQDFINQVTIEISNKQSQLSNLSIEFNTFLNNRKSDFNMDLFRYLDGSIERTLFFPKKLNDSIILPKNKDFETIEQEFLEILDDNEGMDYYDIDEIRDHIMNN